MKKICWITSSFLLDVDIPIVPQLQSDYDIDWIVLTTPSNREGDIKLIEATGCKQYRIIVTSGIFFNPKKFFLFNRLIKEIKGKGYDLYYFDFLGMPYFLPLVQFYLPKDKCIIAAHNVKTPKGARFYWLAKPYMEYVVRTFKNFQVFSKNQYTLLLSIKKHANILCAPLCLKNFGIPTIKKSKSPITFLFFGNIVEYKRIDILLESVNILKAQGITDFKVKIAGYCRKNKWEQIYLPLIKELKNVEVDIRRIPNEDIPNLFESSHYFVMPYQDIAQSGAMTVAFCYNLPIIASKLDTFKEFLNDKKDGVFFETGNSKDLAEKMKLVIKNHTKDYDFMRINQRKLVKDKLSDKHILELYRTYINKLCQH